MIDAADLELLRRHEPILRFTRGELFLPMPTDGYVAACDLLSGPSIREATVVAPAGSLTLDGLGAVGDPPPGHLQFLRFVSRPMNAVELARWRNRPDRPVFQAPGRLARVGLPARLVDAGLVTSLLLRGRVPGGTAAAADRRYAAIRERDPRIAYHGRVVRTAGWVVLHYLFFYAMNDWRSTFDGANDHEADWEQCFVVLEELEDGTTRPAWFCAAAHDEKGDDLRRRWDDPRLESIDGHPVVYPGAGSHAIYLERGEYIMRLPFPGERNLRGPLDLLRRIWRDTLDQPDPGDLSGRVRRAMSVPFVDYARGDGVSVGPGAEHEWTPIPISDADPWVDGYRGPVGSRHRRPVRGRAGPGRPEVHPDRDGPPVVARPARVLRPGEGRPAVAGRGVLAADLVALEEERSAVRSEAETLAAELPGRSEQLASLRGLAGLGRDLDERTAAIHADEARLAALRTRDVELTRVLAAGEARLTALRAGRARRSARPSPACRGARADVPRPAPCVRRGVGGAQRRDADRPARRRRLAADPAGDRGPAGPARRLPRRRGVLRPLGRHPAAADRDAARDRGRDHPGRDVRPGAGPDRPRWASACC